MASARLTQARWLLEGCPSLCGASQELLEGRGGGERGRGGTSFLKCMSRPLSLKWHIGLILHSTYECRIICCIFLTLNCNVRSTFWTSKALSNIIYFSQTGFLDAKKKCPNNAPQWSGMLCTKLNTYPWSRNIRCIHRESLNKAYMMCSLFIQDNGELLGGVV